MVAYSGLFDGTVDANGNGGGGHSLQVNRSPVQKRVAFAFKRRSLRRFGDYMAQLSTGDSPASDVAYDRVQAESDTAGKPVVNGGSRTIETVTVQASTANYSSADVSDADEMGNMSNEPSSYPTDAGGNGGGGKGTDEAPSLG